MTAATLTTAEALEHCRAITRSRARNFYYGLKLAPEPERSALYAVYAWMRRADDLVDEAAGGVEAARQTLESFRRATDDALAGNIDNDPVWIALVDTFKRFPVQQVHLHAMIDGQLDDLNGRVYETFDQLREYCYRVASTVGLVCVEIWGFRDDSARLLAEDRGIAFQLTNILRDLRGDHRQGRTYVPKADLDRHGLDIETLCAWTDVERCTAFVREQIERAETFYRRSEGLETLISPSCVPTLWTMTAIYRGLLEQIAADPHRVVTDRRIRLSSARKALIAAQGAWRARRLRPGTPA